MRSSSLRRLLPFALLTLTVSVARADDPPPPPVDPGWTAPPPPPPVPLEPMPAPTPAPVETPPAPVEVPPAPVEAPPAPVEVPPPPVEIAPPPVQLPPQMPTARRTDTSNLPPPVIRRAGQPRAAAPAPYTPAPYAPAPYTPSAPAPYAPAPYTPSAPAPYVPPPSAPMQPLPGANAAEATILEVVKNHNVPLSDGSLALRLDTRFQVHAAAGGRYRVWITFFDRATGAAVRATRATFADAQGALHVMTKPVASSAAGQEFLAPLTVPYTVFPDPGAGNSTEVEARAELTRVEADGRESAVATSSTTFRVHGAPLEPAPLGSPESAASAFPPPR